MSVHTFDPKNHGLDSSEVSESYPHTVPAKTLASCPRCGHSFEGALATWTEACELNHRCTECGLGFELSAVLGNRGIPNWYVESEGGLRKGIPKVLKTLLMALYPGALWKAIRMEHPVHPKRIACWLLGIFIIAHLALASASALPGIPAMWRLSEAHNAQVVGSPSVDWFGINGGVLLNRLSSEGPIDGWEMSRADMPLIAEIDFVIRLLINPLQLVHFKESTAPQTKPYWIREFDKASPGTVNGSALDIDLLRGPGILRGTVCVMLLIVAQCVSMLVFLFLPYSRASSHVRWGHVVRVWAIGMAIPAMLICGLAVVKLFSLQSHQWVSVEMLRPNQGVFSTFSTLIIVASGVMWAGWWCVAIRKYLRMKDWMPVSFSLILISSLFVLAFFAPLYQDILVLISNP